MKDKTQADYTREMGEGRRFDDRIWCQNCSRPVQIPKRGRTVIGCPKGSPVYDIPRRCDDYLEKPKLERGA